MVRLKAHTTPMGHQTYASNFRMSQFDAQTGHRLEGCCPVENVLAVLFENGPTQSGNRRPLPALEPATSAPAGHFTYTNSFQYSLTSYLRTSSTQVVSSPCRGIS